MRATRAADIDGPGAMAAEPRGSLRVVIADDHRLTVEGVTRTLTASDGIEVVATVHTGSEVLPAVKRTSPDVVLLDIVLPGMDGLACLDLIRKHRPQVKVVMFSVRTDRDSIADTLRRGADAYVLKTVNPEDLPAALRAAVEGTVYYGLCGDEKDSEPHAGLTERELTMLKAIARGLSNKEISSELWVTPQTVKFHLTNVYRKLGLSGRTAAVRYAHEHRLVDVESAHVAS
jgi:DNA-binding NarL/FixJ family response regulator